MKNILFAASLLTLSIWAMEKENKQENQWSITVKNTKINLYRGNMLDSGDAYKADVIVVKRSSTLKENVFLQKNKDKIVEVNEQCIEVSRLLDISYARYKPTYKRYDARLFMRGASQSVDKVVEVALTDLKLCYIETFTKAVQEKNGKIAKSIALPALSIGSYKPHFPSNCELENKAMQCTITTMLEFIKNHPDAYDCIELFVEEEFEFNVCRQLLEIITSQ